MWSGMVLNIYFVMSFIEARGNVAMKGIATKPHLCKREKQWKKTAHYAGDINERLPLNTCNTYYIFFR